MRWALFEEPEPGHPEALAFVECYLHSSMGEHLRQHRRGTEGDRAVLLAAFSLGLEHRPKVRHMVVAGGEEGGLLQRFWQG